MVDSNDVSATTYHTCSSSLLHTLFFSLFLACSPFFSFLSLFFSISMDQVWHICVYMHLYDEGNRTKTLQWNSLIQCYSFVFCLYKYSRCLSLSPWPSWPWELPGFFSVFLNQAESLWVIQSLRTKGASLLAPTGALIVIVVYYTSTAATF